MNPIISGCAKMLIFAEPGIPESYLAILVTGEYNFLAVKIESIVVQSLYSNLEIKTLLLM